MFVAKSYTPGIWIVSDFTPKNRIAWRTGTGGLFDYVFAVGPYPNTEFPIFAVSGRHNRGKVLGCSFMAGDPGDTAEFGLYIANGTHENPTHWPNYTPGGFVYGLPLDTTGQFDPTTPYPGYPHYGRVAEISFANTETPTPTARGGAFVVSVTEKGKVSAINRGWWSSPGYLVLPGRGTYEDAAIAYPEPERLSDPPPRLTGWLGSVDDRGLCHPHARRQRSCRSAGAGDAQDHRSRQCRL